MNTVPGQYDGENLSKSESRTCVVWNEIDTFNSVNN